MINYLVGQAIEWVTTPNKRVVLTLEVNNVGYEIQIPSRFARQLPPAGDRVKVYTHLQLREDGVSLFGFASLAEREVFRQAIAVSGVGAQMALAAIDALGLEEFVKAIVTGNTRALCQAPGIGKKTADRLALELKAKLAQGREIATTDSTNGDRNWAGDSQIREDVEMTLLALGYTEDEIHDALKALSTNKIVAQSSDAEDWIRAAIAWLTVEA